MSDFVSIDLVPILAGLLAALSCGLLGNFLVLRRLSLMGDAISHSVLPGIVVAFLLTSSRAPIPVFIGALIAGLVTVLLVELIRRAGRVESGAAMGVAFSVMFALGVLLMHQVAADRVDLDADCVLHGQLQSLNWASTMSWSDLLDTGVVWLLPRQVHVLTVTLAVVVCFILVMYKELRIAAFDPQLASAQGISPGLMHVLLMLLVAATTVAAFEAVGSILVIAMLIGPAATARLLTERLAPQIGVSALIAVLASLGGYATAVFVPMALGAPVDLSASGMMTSMLGVLLVLAMVFSPSRGLIARALHTHRLAARVRRDDLLASLYREHESGHRTSSLAVAAERWRYSPDQLDSLIVELERSGLAVKMSSGIALTEAGLHEGASIVRKHRLWEAYLVDRAGLRPDHVHDVAEKLEHIPLDESALPLMPSLLDPHGKPIPEPRP